MTIIFFYIFLIDLSFCFNSLRNIESVICPTGNTTIQSGDITSFTISVIDSCKYQIQFSQKAKFGELKKQNEQDSVDISLLEKYECNSQFSYTSSQLGAVETIYYQYVLDDEIKSDTCTYTIYVCNEGCAYCNANNFCLQCKNDMYYIEDNYTKCSFLQKSYYIDGKSQYPCYKDCQSCDGKGTVVTHNCTSCKDTFYEYQKGERGKNCYSFCYGTTEEENPDTGYTSRCISNLFFSSENDTAFTIEMNKDEMFTSIDNEVTKIIGTPLSIKGEDYILDVYLTNKTLEYSIASKIDLSQCLQILRENTYTLDTQFIIAKFDLPRENAISQAKYKIYTTDGALVNITQCSEVKLPMVFPLPEIPTLNITFAQEMSAENGIDVFNTEDPFFNDICFPFAMENNTDITLADRRKYVYQNVSLCDEGCTYNGYDSVTSMINCSCPMETDFDSPEKEAETPLFEGMLASTNIIIGKCYMLLGDIDNYIHNIGFWFLFSIIMLNVTCCTYYFCYFEDEFIKKVIAEEQPKSNPFLNLSGSLSVDDISEKGRMHASSNELIKEEPKDEKEEDKDEDDDLDKLPFGTALEKDNRTLPQMFWFIFISKLEFLNIVVFPGPFDIVSINISVYLFSLALDFTMNAMLFSDDVISDKYHTGEVSFLTSFLLSLFSNIIGYILSYGVVKLSVFSFAFEEIKEEVKQRDKYIVLAYKMLKIIKNRIIIVFVLEFVIELGCIYYVTIFCTVYHSSQKNWFFDCLTGIGISIATSIGIAVLVAFFRYLGLKQNIKMIYNVSKYLNE